MLYYAFGLGYSPATSHFMMFFGVLLLLAVIMVFVTTAKDKNDWSELFGGVAAIALVYLMLLSAKRDIANFEWILAIAGITLGFLAIIHAAFRIPEKKVVFTPKATEVSDEPLPIVQEPVQWDLFYHRLAVKSADTSLLLDMAIADFSDYIFNRASAEAYLAFINE